MRVPQQVDPIEACDALSAEQWPSITLVGWGLQARPSARMSATGPWLRTASSVVTYCPKHEDVVPSKERKMKQVTGPPWLSVRAGDDVTAPR